jgi:hypothetical protein
MDKEVIRIRLVEVDGKDRVEVLIRGDEEILTTMVYSAIQNDNVLTNAILKAVQSLSINRIIEEQKARLN